jgi:octaheme c-type cytochrome (tetrathionate reductase family)
VLTNPPLDVDVHMSPEGQNFACTACHVTKNHQWSGSRYQMLAKDTKGTGKPGFRRHATSCESCHGLQPHPKDSVKHIALNTHVKRVACQSCHIPSFARGGVATRTFWDWRTAGRTKDGKGFVEKNYTQGNGEKRETYWSIKGSFKNGENIVPYYQWFNGESVYTTVDTHFDPSKPVDINHMQGAADDPYSRIWPFKRMETWLMYDKKLNNLVYTHLWGDDDESFWGNFNLPKAVARGMKDEHIPFSGEVGFIKTYSYWPTTHMVAPKANAVACIECHSAGGRLSGVGGVYIAGSHGVSMLDKIAWFVFALTGFAILIHLLLRFWSKRRVES